MTLLQMALGLGMLAMAGMLAIVQGTAAEPASSRKSCTPEDLVGRYFIVSGEKYGMEEPEDRVKGTVVTFSKDDVLVADKDKRELYSATYKLDSTKNPATIVMTSRVRGSSGEEARGLIEKDGDTVRLIYALPTGEIPRGFKTREKQLMFVMKKES